MRDMPAELEPVSSSSLQIVYSWCSLLYWLVFILVFRQFCKCVGYPTQLENYWCFSFLLSLTLALRSKQISLKICSRKQKRGEIEKAKIGIITGSTRDSRVNKQVAEWIQSIANNRTDATFELVDIKEYNLPRYNESVPAVFSKDYATPEAHPWSEKIDFFDGFIFVVAEYNKGITSGLKDAIDYLYQEWNHKAAGIVSYGSTLGVSAANELRLILSVPKVATVGTHVGLSLFTDFENMSKFQPADFHQNTVEQLLDEVIAWATALKTIRTTEKEKVAK